MKPDPSTFSLPLLEDALEQHGTDAETDAAAEAGQEESAFSAKHPDAKPSGANNPGANIPGAKPSWRGWIHAATLPIAIAAGIVLICVAHGTIAKWAASVYMISSILLFGGSALYHRFHWKPRAAAALRRFDHANIFLLIAGTYTPVALLTLPLDKGELLLTLVWIGALLGIGFHMFWINAPRWIYVPLYLLLGWAAVMYLGEMAHNNVGALVLIVVGGGLYTLGAVVYGLKRPNPWPGHFGFHEIFHALTVAAFLCHWVAALLASLDPVYLR